MARNLTREGKTTLMSFIGSLLSAPIVLFGVFLLGGGTQARLEGVQGMWRALFEYRVLFEVRTAGVDGTYC